MKITLVLLYVLFLTSHLTYAQCTGGISAGTLTPTVAYQTQTVSNGQYYTINVSCGSTYNFTFCSNGGSASWDTQLTILNSTGTYVGYGYSDDACGLQSNVSYTSTFTGTIRILISNYPCNNSGGSSGTLAYNSNNVTITPTFTLSSSSCTQATATITGTTGGTFSFNPAPGDGATINATTGSISNGIAGSSYTVRYTVCGNSSNQSITLPSTNCWELNGNAQWITVAGEDCIQLTAEVNNQTGCAWDENLIDFNTNFTLSLDYYFGNNINGADGTTFTFQPNPGACGTNGGQLGAGGIANSLVIEFDTYDNDNPTHVVDIAADHIAVEIDGNLQNSSHLCGPTAALASNASIDDGAIHSVDIQWVAATQTLSIYFDGNLRITCNYNFVTNVFGGDNTVYWGATAATGGLNNQQYFCPETIIFLPSELLSFNSYCNEINEIIYWSTASEDRVDYFEVEYTFDGQLFYPIGVVNAVGNSTEINHYQIESKQNDSKQKYYRLKTVDTDGFLKTSELIAGKNCGEINSELLEEYSFQDNNLNLHLNNTNIDVKLISADGKELLKTQTTDEKKLLITNMTLSQGVYFLNLSDKINNRTKTYKIYHSKN